MQAPNSPQSLLAPWLFLAAIVMVVTLAAVIEVIDRNVASEDQLRNRTEALNADWKPLEDNKWVSITTSLKR